MAYQEKPAVRPIDFIQADQWGDIEYLKRTHEELKARIRRRTGDVWEDERRIYANTQIAKRIRELEPTLIIPRDSDDTSVRFHSLAVHQRAVRMATHNVHDAAHLAGSRSTTRLDIASERLRKLIRGRDQHPENNRDTE